MASSQVFCDACANAMAGHLGMHPKHVSSTCSVAGSCSRRLSVLPNSLTRKLAGQHAVRVEYRITAPPGQSSSVMASLNSVVPSALQSLISANLVGTDFQSSVNSVTALSQPTTSVSHVGFECYSGQSCLFDDYELGSHYKIHKKTAFNSTECAQACYADQTCEAFESLSAAFVSTTGNSLPYHCAFWMHGACNIEAVGSKALGYVSGYSGVLFCDKNTSRNPVLSNSQMLGFKSAMFSMLFMLSQV